MGVEAVESISILISSATEPLEEDKLRVENWDNCCLTIHSNLARRYLEAIIRCVPFVVPQLFQHINDVVLLFDDHFTTG